MSIFHTSGSRTSIKKVMRKLPMILSTSPARTICGMVMYRLPKTTALGGVAVGRRKAYDTDIPAATMRQ